MCVIVPDEEVLVEWAKNNSLTHKFEELCQSEVNTVGYYEPPHKKTCLWGF